jgi:hypothetical protein
VLFSAFRTNARTRVERNLRWDEVMWVGIYGSVQKNQKGLEKLLKAGLQVVRGIAHIDENTV